MKLPKFSTYEGSNNFKLLGPIIWKYTFSKKLNSVQVYNPYLRTKACSFSNISLLSNVKALDKDRSNVIVIVNLK